MGLFSGITHAIGKLFGGGDDEDKKKKQQQQQQQVWSDHNAPADNFQDNFQPSQNQRNNNFNQTQQKQAVTDLLSNPLIKAAGKNPKPLLSPVPSDPNALIKATVDPKTLPDYKPTVQEPVDPDKKPGFQLSNNALTRNIRGAVQQGARTVRAVARPVVDLGSGQGGKLINDTSQLGSDVSGGGANYFLKSAIADPLKEEAAHFTGNDVALRKAETQSNVDLGLGEDGTHLGDALKKYVGNTAQIGSLAIGAPELSAASRGSTVAGVLNKARAIAPLSAAGTIGAEGNVLANSPDASSKDFLKASALGFLGGTALPVAGQSLSKAISTGARGAEELSPGVVSSNPHQIPDAIKQTTTDVAQQAPVLPPIEPAKVSSGARDLPELGNQAITTPAYQRGFGTAPEAPVATPSPQALYKADQGALRRAASPAGQTFEAGLDPRNVNDAVPAFQRRGEVQTPEAQARIAEITDELSKTPELDSRSLLFNARNEAGTKIANNPAIAPQARQLLAATEQKITANAQRREALQSELDSLTGQKLGTNDQFTVGDLLDGSQPPAVSAPGVSADRIPAPGIENVSPPVEATPPAAAVPTPSAAVEVAPGGGDIPTIPDLPTGNPEVPVAPRTRAALVKQVGDVAKSLPKEGKTRETVNLNDLKANAAGSLANMTDDDVLAAFASSQLDELPHGINGVATARAAIDRLAKMDPENPDVAAAVGNALDAIAERSSQSGLIQRFIQEDFDKLPLPMKVRYIAKKIDRANVETKGYEPLADDPARAAIVEATITGHLQSSQAIAERVAQTEGKLNDIADSLNNGEKSSENINSLVKSLKDDQRQLAANNGELVKYYTEQLPKPKRGQKVNDFARTMMLSSFTGRVNDVVSTSANIAQLGAQNVTQGILSAGVNLLSPGKVTSTLRGTKQFFQGTAEGLKKSKGEFSGKQYANDLQHSLDDNSGARTGLKKTNNKLNRTVQAATEFATNASEGVRDQKLYQLADQEAAKAGLKGSMRRQYAQVRAAVPTRQMAEKADQLHKEVNNLNENPVTRGLNRVAAGIEGKSAVGGFLKNQVVPFTSWLGGNIFNTITDKNVVAAFVKTINSAAKGDAEGVVRNLAKTANNAAYTYALGYMLTKAGVITNQDAEGYNDGGAYIKIGDRYIPAGFAGFFAPNIILGNATYNAMNSKDGGSIAERIVSGGGEAIANLAKSVNITSALGADNNITRSIETSNRPGGSFGDGAATFGAGAAGQFIPGLAGDVNSTLNNGLTVGGKTIVPDTLNPTHEAALTKVSDPNSKSGTAKDVPKSALQGLKNRVPFLSQTLPRKANVAADDLVDRTTKGDRDTFGGENIKSQDKAQVDQAKDFKARGVPNPEDKNFDDTIKARFEDGKYDQAIEGLQAKLKKQEANQDIPKSKNKTIEDQIKLYQVHKDGGFAPEVADLYKKTSLTEWRNMGNPENDAYDPDTYQKLFDYDNARAKSDISKSTLDASKNAYTAKVTKAKSGGGGGRGGSGSAANAELARIKSNTIGSLPDFHNIDFGALAPKKITDVKIPTIQQIKPGELIKKRVISVGKGQG